MAKRKTKIIIESSDQLIDMIINLKEKYKNLNEIKKEYNQLGRHLSVSQNHNLNSFWVIEKMINHIYKKGTKDYENVLKYFLSSDKELAFSYFQYGTRLSNEIRRCAFENIIQYPDEVFSNLIGLRYRNMPFDKEETAIYFEKYGAYHYKQVENTLNDLYKYCSFFAKYLTEQQKELLITRILGRKHISYAKHLLSGEIFKLTEEMKERLESLILFDKIKNPSDFY